MNALLKRMLAQAGYMNEAGDGTEGGSGGAAGGAGGKGDGAAGDAGGKGDGESGAKDGDSGAKKGSVSDEEARLLKENMKKKGQIDDLAKQLASAQSMLKQLEEFGGLETVKSLVGERKDAETKALEAKGDYERLKARMAEEHSKQVKALEDQLAAVRGDLSKQASVISDLTVGSQFGQSQFISGELTLTPAKARVIYGDYFDVIEGGNVVGFDKPRGAAGRTALVDSYGNSISFDAALRKIIEADPEKDHLLKSKIKAGAGSSSIKAGETAGKKDAPQDSVSKIAAGLAAMPK